MSINLQTAKRRAVKLLADMRQLGATAFVINRGDGTQLYRWRPEDKINEQAALPRPANPAVAPTARDRACPGERREGYIHHERPERLRARLCANGHVGGRLL